MPSYRDKLEKEWKQYPVFHLSFGGQNFVEPYTLDKVLEEFVAILHQIINEVSFIKIYISTLYDLVQNGNIYFLCRPRRFGKSLLVSTLKCYFEGKKELFKGLAIDKLEKEWKQYPVFHLSFGGQNFVEPYTLDKVLEEFVAMAERIYGREELAETLGSRFKAVLGKAHQKTGMRAVVLIDEYDKPLLDVMDMDIPVGKTQNKISLEEYNRNLLKGFYSVFKEYPYP